MRSPVKVAAMVCGLMITLSAFAATAEAAGRYGPAGLGSNLHRRFVLKQASKSVSQGRPVRGRQIIWQTRPSSRIYRSVPGFRGW